ncbi:MAG: CHC2 zinc finger domain-containing protein [Verrucomicrobiales bacterium]
MNSWVNFKILREKLQFSQVLTHYGVTAEPKGNQVVTFCPLPGHNGKKNSPSFSANLHKGIFQCFGCGAKGNSLDFAVLMEKHDPENGVHVRKIALELQRRFNLNSRVTGEISETPASPPAIQTSPIPRSAEVVVNEPLKFTLTGLDPDHPYLQSRGFTAGTIENFGIGYCPRGHFQGRIVIPLHDTAGKLIGYAGRIVDDAKVSKDCPKYLFPGKRLVNGKAHEFHKGTFVYNGYRFPEPLHNLIIVDGFPSVWWLTQNGYPQVVALMGSTLVGDQVEVLAKLIHPEGKAWIMMDGDPAGKRISGLLHLHLGAKRFTRSIPLLDNQQPTGLGPEELDQHFIDIQSS